MEEPIIAQKGPYAVEVEEGKSYYWCACGRSGSQPFCDGSHKVTSFNPVQFTAEPTQSFHLIYKKRLIPEHKPVLKEDFKDIERMAILYKQNKLYLDWVAELRSTIYWEIKE